MASIRVGMGYDVHKLVADRELWLGGIRIESSLGLLGHSDADVLIHALCDALLGAANCRDIGYHFPDNDPKYKGADSTLLLKSVIELVTEKGYKIGNIDSNIIAQAPKMMPHIPAIKQKLAEVMKIDADLISVKAKTKEKLDAVGEKLAIETNAVVLLYKI